MMRLYVLAALLAIVVAASATVSVKPCEGNSVQLFKVLYNDHTKTTSFYYKINSASALPSGVYLIPQPGTVTAVRAARASLLISFSQY